MTELWTTEQYQAYLNKKAGRKKSLPKQTHMIINGKMVPVKDMSKRKGVDKSKWKSFPWNCTETIPLPVYPSRNQTDAMHWAKRGREKEKYKQDVAVVLLNDYGFQKGLYAKEKIRLEIRLFFKTKRTRDEDNYAPKWLLDALQGIILFDDSPEYLTWQIIDFSKKLIDKENPHIEITISREESHG